MYSLGLALDRPNPLIQVYMMVSGKRDGCQRDKQDEVDTDISREV